jgi:PKD repeat protein
MHNGGAMAFGNDGLLYITTGDGGDREVAQPLDNVCGSIIRLNDDGTVPDSNPFTKASGYANSYRCADSGGYVPGDAPDDSVCSEVFANGLRNPFRIAMDPGTTDKVLFSIGAVGAQHTEALYYGGTDYEGANYGWPKYEGPCVPGGHDDCPALGDDRYVKPFHWYEHINPSGTGGCVGGQAFVPAGVWPEEFKFLFLDFIFLKLYTLQTDVQSRACDDCNPPKPPTRNETFYRSIQEDGESVNNARMTHVFFGPYQNTQALYVIKFGQQDTVLRIRYSGIDDTPPEPAFSFQMVTETSVQFDGSASYDPEGMPLTYSWEFGDGGASTDEKPLHEYAGSGEYTATLFVTDAAGQKQQVSQTVKVGQVPTVNILSPTIFDFFSVGQILRIQGEASDFEGNAIADDKLEWEVRQHHADHWHPFLDVTPGNNLEIPSAPEPEDYLAATNSFLEVILTATDLNGLTNTVSIEVKPRVVMVDVDTIPQGLEIVIDDYEIVSPYTITSWDGFDLPVEVEDQPPYVFQKWSDGLTDRSRIMAVSTDLTDPKIVAHFCLALDNACSENEDCCSGYCGTAKECEIQSNDDRATATPALSNSTMAPSNSTMAPSNSTLAPAPTSPPSNFSLAAPTSPPVPAPTLPPVVFTLPPTSDISPPAQPPVQGTLETPADQDDEVEPSEEDEPWTPVFDDAIDYDSTTDSLNDFEGNQAESSSNSGGLEAIIIVLLVLSTLALLALCFCCYIKRRKNHDDGEYRDSVIKSFYGRGTMEDEDDASSKTGSDKDRARRTHAVGNVSTDESHSQEEYHSAHSSASDMEEGKDKIDERLFVGSTGVSQGPVVPFPPMTEQSGASRDVEFGAVYNVYDVNEPSPPTDSEYSGEGGILSYSSTHLVDSSAYENSALYENMNDTSVLLPPTMMQCDLMDDVESSQVDDESVTERVAELSVQGAVNVSSDPVSLKLQQDHTQSNSLLSFQETSSQKREFTSDLQKETSLGVEPAEKAVPIPEPHVEEYALGVTENLHPSEDSRFIGAAALEEADESMFSYMSEVSQEAKRSMETSLLGSTAVVEEMDDSIVSCDQAPHATELPEVSATETQPPVFELPIDTTPPAKTPFKSRSSAVGEDTPDTVASMTPTPNSKRSGKPWASDLQLVSSDLSKYTSSRDDLEA